MPTLSLQNTVPAIQLAPTRQLTMTQPLPLVSPRSRLLVLCSTQPRYKPWSTTSRSGARPLRGSDQSLLLMSHENLLTSPVLCFHSGSLRWTWREPHSWMPASSVSRSTARSLASVVLRSCTNFRPTARPASCSCRCLAVLSGRFKGLLLCQNTA